ncbi:nitrate- and nitrite sensing domain-containing protein [Actinoplanes sp. NBRC 101535]|uniref:sensor histidine kinase n=1 Tax=Actinoplanes sp. NBRC 101535 TaxID=3032196 RepID=UPI0024A0FC06|nr:nitrate- and nitrite sensing domain-containing protein [Actinoplanes sp. NBRC 101535]GLY05151.1 histidine kinase [Actinoplanes sp. NBRC 101535]
MLFGKFRILGKLALLVLVPLLGVVGLSVPVIYERANAARIAQETSDTVQLATQVSSALIQLQEERLLSVGYRLGLVEQPVLVVQSAETADAIAILDRTEGLSLEMRRAVNIATRLDSTRQNVLNGTVTPVQIVDQFTSVVTPLIDGLGLSTSADLSTGVGRQVFALEQAMRSDDLISQASGYLAIAATAKPGSQDADLLLNQFNATFAEISSIIASSKVFFTDAQYKLYLNTQEAFSFRIGSKFITALQSNPSTAIATLNVETLFPSLQSVTVLGSFVEKRVAKDVDVTVTANRDSAIQQALLIGGGALLLLILVVTLSIFMARAVARPLRRLTVSADRIARAAEAELERVADDEQEAAVRPIRLDPVDVEAQDEIGDLARAFDRVQTTAARLVERQVLGRRNVAQMFGHVGRRTQNLVGRQLSLIDGLERRETDSDRLRELYRLDHMSSRLRRNASALVVLSGAAGANEHMAPLPLSDVVRLALGEIEDYTRVEVDIPEDIVVVPAVLADLTLLLAELLENATTFSPPHTNVTVSADELRGGARLAIIDHGLGLAPERLAEENARLTRRERLDLAPTEVLGLFVVGRLARRHGIEVTLTDTPDGGLTAWIDLNPSHMIARTESLAPVPAIQTAHTAAAAVQAPPAMPAPAEMPQIQAPEYGMRPVSAQPAMAPAYSAALRGNTTEVAIASSAVRSVPGSQQPFDPNKLSRATHTLESSNSWNAFGGGGRETADPYAGQPVYDAEPVYSPGPAYQEPVYTTGSGLPEQAPSFDMGTPVAGRVPAALPELPSAAPAGPVWSHEQQAVQPAWGQTPAAPAAWNTPSAPTPSEAIPIPHQRSGDDFTAQPPAVEQPAATPPSQRNGAAPLRRRVPGSQLPQETAPQQHAKAPTQDDALAARAAFDAFEAGVSKAQWDVAETSATMPAPMLGRPDWEQPAIGGPQWDTPAPSSPAPAPQWNTPAPSSPVPAPQWNTPAPAASSWDAPASNGGVQWNVPSAAAAAPAAAAPPAPPAPPGAPAGLTRRVPGASLPNDEPYRPTPPPAPAQLDPDAARALMDQFEYGVALALNESQPQHEGQPR